MKICFLGDAASVHIRRWCEFFRDVGDEVSIISFRDANIPGVAVYFIGDEMKINSDGGNLSYIKKSLYINKLIKKIKPDILNAHYLTSYGFLGCLANYKPIVVSTWGSDILVTPKRNIIYKKLTQYVIKRVNLITSDSNFMSEEIVRLGADKNKVITAPMGIEIDRFNSKREESTNPRTFLSMRTLCKNSNIDYILKAFKEIIKKKPYCRLITFYFLFVLQ